ncbi:MAG: iron-sulfur cluster binding protein, partial [uncultured bacterium]
ILDSLQVELCFYIEKQGYQALPIPASQVVDFKQMTAHLSHRHIAYLAGLGWYGRNNLLVHHLYGSSLRFATVLTDMPLTLGKITSNDCGPCRKCATLCPANAINESFRDFSKDKCQEKLREFQRKPGVNHMICGVCVKACRGKKTWVK